MYEKYKEDKNLSFFFSDKLEDERTDEEIIKQVAARHWFVIHGLNNLTITILIVKRFSGYVPTCRQDHLTYLVFTPFMWIT